VAATNKKLGYAAIAIGVLGVVVFAAVGYVVRGRLKDKPAAAESATADSPRRVSPKTTDPKSSSPRASEATVPTAGATPATPSANPPSVNPNETAAAAPQTPVSSPATTPPMAAAPTAPRVVAPSSAFVAWVKNLKITGVRTGAAPRILVERATFAVGEIMNSELGVTFDGYDASRRMLRFKDKTGAIVERRER
jgi:hypothetical protein